MKKTKQLMLAIMLLILITSCQRVEPNYAGVLMENFGKSGKSDFSIVVGRISTIAPGTQLYQVPLFQQRAGYEEKSKLKAADNTEFTAKPSYSYKIVKSRAVDVVFDNKQLGNDNFMKSLEDNIIEPYMYDIMKEESRKYSTDSLMATGGNLRFEKTIEEKIKKIFEDKGMELLTFSANLDFADKVKAKIENRNEVNTNVTVIDQQIIEQRKKNELAELQAQENIIRSRGITEEILKEQAIRKWNGQLPSAYSNNGNGVLFNIPIK